MCLVTWQRLMNPSIMHLMQFFSFAPEAQDSSSDQMLFLYTCPSRWNKKRIRLFHLRLNPTRLSTKNLVTALLSNTFVTGRAFLGPVPFVRLNWVHKLLCQNKQVIFQGGLCRFCCNGWQRLPLQTSFYKCPSTPIRAMSEAQNLSMGWPSLLSTGSLVPLRPTMNESHAQLITYTVREESPCWMHCFKV